MMTKLLACLLIGFLLGAGTVLLYQQAHSIKKTQSDNQTDKNFYDFTGKR